MAVKVKEAEEGVVVVYNKKTPAQKIRDYFNTPKWKVVEKVNLSGKYKFK